jgi:hypothetical protein
MHNTQLLVINTDERWEDERLEEGGVGGGERSEPRLMKTVFVD